MWILFSQISSLTDAVKNILLKSLPKEVDSLLINWLWLFFTTLALLPLLFIQPIPQLDSIFWVVIIVRMIFDPIAIYLFTRSLRMAEFSLVLPLLTLGPVITMLSSIVINHEIPTFLGIAGVLLVLSGVYFLNFKKDASYLAPFHHLSSEASLSMLTAAVLWGVQISLFKLGITHSSPGFFTFAGSLGVFAVFSAVVLVKLRHQMPLILNAQFLKQVAVIGALDGATVYLRMLALSTGLAGYVAALNRTSIIFGSVLGYFLYREKIQDRIVPISIMFVGVILIVMG